jgi:hypothetical protein
MPYQSVPPELFNLIRVPTAKGPILDSYHISSAIDHYIASVDITTRWRNLGQFFHCHLFLRCQVLSLSLQMNFLFWGRLGGFASLNLVII